MSNIVLDIENVSKLYRLGQVGARSMKDDLIRFFYRMRGKENPFLEVGATNDRTVFSTSDYVWALKDIDFQVNSGEVLGIIGRNGAGKSTLLKLLSKVTKPTSGSIKIRGRIASLLEVGTGFHPELTGRENVFLNGTILGMTRQEIKSKFDAIIDFAGVEKYIDTPVKRYSSGMTVRLAFAVAAHLEPEILIIDEVLAVGDIEFQEKCLGKMKHVAGQGRTIIFVSHNMAAIKSLCTKGILLEKGTIDFNGNIHETVARYISKNLSNASVTGEIPGDIQRMGTGECRFTYLALKNEGDELTSELNFRDPIRINFKVRVNRKISSAFFWLQINSADGVQIVLIESEYKGTELEPGEYDFTVSTNARLIPGKYVIAPSVYWSGTSGIDVLGGILQFTVLNSASEGNESYKWQRSYGYVHADSSWQYSKM